MAPRTASRPLFSHGSDSDSPDELPDVLGHKPAAPVGRSATVSSSSASRSNSRTATAPPIDSRIEDGTSISSGGDAEMAQPENSSREAHRDDSFSDAGPSNAHRADDDEDEQKPDLPAEEDQQYEYDSDEDEDDPVIKSIPVFLTPALASSLALLQYPHRPANHSTPHPLLPPSLRPAEGEDGSSRPKSAKITARFKPEVSQLELSLPLEVREGREQQRYNDERARALGRGISDADLGADGSSKGSAKAGKGGKGKGSLAYEEGNDTPLERLTLQGETVPDQTWYAAAILKDNEIHLTPLTRTLQMRPHLTYLDRADAIERQNARRERQAREGEESDDLSDANASSDPEDSTNKSAAAIAAKKAKKASTAEKKRVEGELKAVQTSVRSTAAPPAGGDADGKGPGDARVGRAAASLFGPQKAAETEKWVDLPYYDQTSDEANRMYDQLFADKVHMLEMVTKATQYLRL